MPDTAHGMGGPSQDATLWHAVAALLVVMLALLPILTVGYTGTDDISELSKVRPQSVLDSFLKASTMTPGRYYYGPAMLPWILVLKYVDEAILPVLRFAAAAVFCLLLAGFLAVLFRARSVFWFALAISSMLLQHSADSSILARFPYHYIQAYALALWLTLVVLQLRGHLSWRLRALSVAAWLVTVVMYEVALAYLLPIALLALAWPLQSPQTGRGVLKASIRRALVILWPFLLVAAAHVVLFCIHYALLRSNSVYYKGTTSALAADFVFSKYLHAMYVWSMPSLPGSLLLSPSYSAAFQLFSPSAHGHSFVGAFDLTEPECQVLFLKSILAAILSFSILRRLRFPARSLFPWAVTALGILIFLAPLPIAAQAANLYDHAPAYPETSRALTLLLHVGLVITVGSLAIAICSQFRSSLLRTIVCAATGMLLGTGAFAVGYSNIHVYKMESTPRVVSRSVEHMARVGVFEDWGRGSLLFSPSLAETPFPGAHLSEFYRRMSVTYWRNKFAAITDGRVYFTNELPVQIPADHVYYVRALQSHSDGRCAIVVARVSAESIQAGRPSAEHVSIHGYPANRPFSVLMPNLEGDVRDAVVEGAVACEWGATGLLLQTDGTVRGARSLVRTDSDQPGRFPGHSAEVAVVSVFFNQIPIDEIVVVDYR